MSFSNYESWEQLFELCKKYPTEAASEIESLDCKIEALETEVERLKFKTKELIAEAERYVDDCSVDAVKRDDGLSIEEAIKTQVRLDFLNHLKDWVK